ncbi:hypothetical protein MMC22_010480 [Lobaria immixta]|nr:hypothetical protein [Lobaria immixta]
MNNHIIGFTDPAISTTVYDISGLLKVYYNTIEDRNPEGLLYQGFQAKLFRRYEELGEDMAKVKAEAGPEVMTQANSLYYTHIWRKTPDRHVKKGYWVEIYRYWRDISYGMARKDYDHLWQYVAEKRLPVKLMVVPSLKA